MENKFEYDISIKATFTNEDWIEIFKQAKQNRFKSWLEFGEWLYGIHNRLYEFGYDEIYLTFRQIDKLSTMFELPYNPILYDKCANMCKAINEEYNRLYKNENI